MLAVRDDSTWIEVVFTARRVCTLHSLMQRSENLRRGELIVYVVFLLHFNQQTLLLIGLIGLLSDITLR